MSTCKPMPGVAVEMWSANATVSPPSPKKTPRQKSTPNTTQGVYSGVVDFMNGGLKSDTRVVNNQALRGFQLSDASGAVEFETIVPGHYQGRAHHIHVATHLDPKVQKNGTISGSQVLHVGQLYLDQDLTTLVEKNEPYKSNKAPLMLNKDDMLLAQGSAGGADPVVEYVLLGPDIKDGIFAWINFGVDSKAKRTMRAATICSESGCKSGTADMLKGLEPYIPALTGAWEGLKNAFGLGSAPKSDPAAGGVPVVAPAAPAATPAAAAPAS
jgi:protocatechuate 3,4-dioxygenase beta subunit